MLRINRPHTVCSTIPCLAHSPLNSSVLHKKTVHVPFIKRNIRTVPRKQWMSSAESESPKDAPTAETGLDYVLGQGNYRTVVFLLSTFSLSLMLIPSFMADKLFAVSLLPVSELLLRSYGAILLLPATLAYCMQAAYDGNRLDSPTYKRLSFSLALSFATICVIKFLAISRGVAPRPAYVWVSTVLEILPTVSFIKIYGMGIFSDIIPGIMSGISSVFQPDTIKSGMYSILTAVFMLLAGFMIGFPQKACSIAFTFPVDVFAKLLVQVLGSMMLMVSLTCFTLKDAADRNRLGFSTFKNLNGALAVESVAKFSVIMYVCEMSSRAAKAAGSDLVCIMTAAGGVPILGLCIILALFCGFNAITAKME